jgi:hypothetical protein
VGILKDVFFGPVSHKYPQGYLNEFTFRLNHKDDAGADVQDDARQGRSGLRLNEGRLPALVPI